MGSSWTYTVQKQEPSVVTTHQLATSDTGLMPNQFQDAKQQNLRQEAERKNKRRKAVAAILEATKEFLSTF